MQNIQNKYYCFYKTKNLENQIKIDLIIDNLVKLINFSSSFSNNYLYYIFII